MVSSRPRLLEDQQADEQVQVEVAAGAQAVVTFDQMDSSASTYHEMLQAQVNFRSTYGPPPDARGSRRVRGYQPSFDAAAGG